MSIILVKVQSLQEYGKMIKKFKDNLYSLMEIYLKVHSKITKDIMVYINIEMVIYTKVHGKMIWNKVTVNLFSLMDKNIKEILFKDKKINMACIFGSMETGIKAILFKINDKD